MPKVLVSVRIAAPRRVVWRAIEDIASHVDWMLDASEIRFLTPHRAGVGTTFECDTKIGPFKLTDTMTVTEWEAGRAMGVSHSGLVTGTGRFTLHRAARGGTRVRWREELDFPWWMGGGAGELGAKPILSLVWRKNLRNLKALIEPPGSDR